MSTVKSRLPHVDSVSRLVKFRLIGMLQFMRQDESSGALQVRRFDLHVPTARHFLLEISDDVLLDEGDRVELPEVVERVLAAELLLLLIRRDDPVRIFPAVEYLDEISDFSLLENVESVEINEVEAVRHSKIISLSFRPGSNDRRSPGGVLSSDDEIASAHPTVESSLPGSVRNV